ncbi:MAG TPA: DUF4157 domain-containing protein [Bryobacteraceae bacterium]
MQPKLRIGAVDDPLEREADRVSDAVMRMPLPEPAVSHGGSSIPARIQRSCACGGMCASCQSDHSDDEHQHVPVQRATRGPTGVTAAPPVVHETLRSPGQPLDRVTRSFLEPRFGRDFSGVRIHTGTRAAESARAIEALAYTLGEDIAFNTGEYAPHTPKGVRLLTHELAHVVQQAGRPIEPQASVAVNTPGDASERQADAAADTVMAGRAVPPLGSISSAVQRTCGSALGAPRPDCTPSTAGTGGQQFLFDVNCDDLKDVEVKPGKSKSGETAVAEFAKTVPAGSKINVHGFASGEGPEAFNEALSCHRANKVASLLGKAGLAVDARFKHGGISVSPPPRSFWRSAIVEVVKSQKPLNLCGPDVTDWFVAIVAKAKADKTVLEIQANLQGASRIAASHGFSAERVAEGGVAKKVFAEEARTKPADSPAFPRPTGQFASSAAGQREFGRALLAAPVPVLGAPDSAVLLMIRRASLAWKNLVGTGKRYDFKNNVLHRPTSASCPNNCANSVTICPTPVGSCYNTDVPGNLFYAHMGRFIGFTELALQLGSQFAQLESSSHWDPPEDTNMISAGYTIKDPLDRAELCSVMTSLRSTISQRACQPCPQATSAAQV